MSVETSGIAEAIFFPPLLFSSHSFGIRCIGAIWTIKSRKIEGKKNITIGLTVTMLTFKFLNVCQNNTLWVVIILIFFPQHFPYTYLPLVKKN